MASLFFLVKFVITHSYKNYCLINIITANDTKYNNNIMVTVKWQLQQKPLPSVDKRDLNFGWYKKFFSLNNDITGVAVAVFNWAALLLGIFWRWFGSKLAIAAQLPELNVALIELSLRSIILAVDETLIIESLEEHLLFDRSRGKLLRELIVKWTLSTLDSPLRQDISLFIG